MGAALSKKVPVVCPLTKDWPWVALTSSRAFNMRVIKRIFKIPCQLALYMYESLMTKYPHIGITKECLRIIL